MRLTNIYTKVGDKGTTILATGDRVDKSAPRIEAYGTVDELNSITGILRDALTSMRQAEFQHTTEQLQQIQNELFDLGAELATPLRVLDDTKQNVVGPELVSRLESEIDDMNKNLPPLENFILPGGNIANSYAHLARTVCRRAERRVVAMGHVEEIRPEVVIYLNRLSDWFFVVSRFISRVLGVPETLWDQHRT